MNRLTQKDDCGDWSVKGLPWENLRERATIIKETHEKLYGCLCKLKDYEDTELSPDDVERVNNFEQSQAGQLLLKLSQEREKHSWIPVENRLPETDGYILLSFENFDVPLVGRYETSKDGGGKFYVGDDMSCISADLFVNAWMPLPKPYREDVNEEGTEEDEQ